MSLPQVLVPVMLLVLLVLLLLLMLLLYSPTSLLLLSMVGSLFTLRPMLILGRIGVLGIGKGSEEASTPPPPLIDVDLVAPLLRLNSAALPLSHSTSDSDSDSSRKRRAALLLRRRRPRGPMAELTLARRIASVAFKLSAARNTESICTPMPMNNRQRRDIKGGR